MWYQMDDQKQWLKNWKSSPIKEANTGIYRINGIKAEGSKNETLGQESEKNDTVRPGVHEMLDDTTNNKVPTGKFDTLSDHPRI